jgi:mono/diheme cytochrome c family protein
MEGNMIIASFSILALLLSATAHGLDGQAATKSPAAPSSAAKGSTLDGKQIFMSQKCNTCHAVSSASITAKTKVKGGDLAGLANKEDAAWLGKYLRKEGDKKGKKHAKAFTGSDEELGALIAWLQKQEKK